VKVATAANFIFHLQQQLQGKALPKLDKLLTDSIS
jgi:hypothetical protein